MTVPTPKENLFPLLWALLLWVNRNLGFKIQVTVLVTLASTTSGEELITGKGHIRATKNKLMDPL